MAVSEEREKKSKSTCEDLEREERLPTGLFPDRPSVCHVTDDGFLRSNK
jgi:hypothetical protein